MSKLFFGGVPTNADIRKLDQTYIALQVGEELTHEDLATILGVDARSNRYRTVMSRWVRHLLSTKGIQLGAIPSVGFRVLSDSERVEKGMLGTRSGSRKIARSIAMASLVTTDDPALQKKQELMRRFGAGLSAQASELAKQIEPTSPTLQIVRKPPKEAI